VPTSKPAGIKEQIEGGACGLRLRLALGAVALLGALLHRLRLDVAVRDGVIDALDVVLERRRHRQQHSLRRQRLLEKVECAELGCFHGVGKAGAPTHHDHRQVRGNVAQPRQGRHAIQLTRHHEVYERDVGLSLPHPRDCFDTVRRLDDFVAFARQQRADHPTNVRLVVGDQDDRHLG